MAQIDKNTVKADNQLKKNLRITFDNETGKGKRILFVGNSITRHAPKPDIGWDNDWGMAASSIDKDYVHLTEKAVLDIDKDAVFCICQSAGWEVNCREGELFHEDYVSARDFKPDIIVMRLVENCRIKEEEVDLFEEKYKNFVDYLKGDSDAKVIVTSSFWICPGDKALEKAASDIGADFVYLGDLGEQAEMRADGLFEHSGVAAHPGDLGMYNIYERIFEKIKKYL